MSRRRPRHTAAPAPPPHPGSGCPGADARASAEVGHPRSNLVTRWLKVGDGVAASTMSSLVEVSTRTRPTPRSRPRPPGRSLLRHHQRRGRHRRASAARLGKIGAPPAAAPAAAPSPTAPPPCLPACRAEAPSPSPEPQAAAPQRVAPASAPAAQPLAPAQAASAAGGGLPTRTPAGPEKAGFPENGNDPSISLARTWRRRAHPVKQDVLPPADAKKAPVAPAVHGRRVQPAQTAAAGVLRPWPTLAHLRDDQKANRSGRSPRA